MLGGCDNWVSTVYLACTSVRRFWRFELVCRIVESTTSVPSIGCHGTGPTAATNQISNLGNFSLAVTYRLVRPWCGLVQGRFLSRLGGQFVQLVDKGDVRAPE